VRQRELRFTVEEAATLLAGLSLKDHADLSTPATHARADLPS
jgi:hypothetical protein